MLVACGVWDHAFIPRVDKVAHRELVWQRGLQLLCIYHQVVVQETRVGVEQLHLTSAGLHHIWVTVAHWMEERTHTGSEAVFTFRTKTHSLLFKSSYCNLWSKHTMRSYIKGYSWRTGAEIDVFNVVDQGTSCCTFLSACKKCSFHHSKSRLGLHCKTTLLRSYDEVFAHAHQETHSRENNSPLLLYFAFFCWKLTLKRYKRHHMCSFLQVCMCLCVQLCVYHEPRCWCNPNSAALFHHTCTGLWLAQSWSGHGWRKSYKMACRGADVSVSDALLHSGITVYMLYSDKIFYVTFDLNS